MSDDVDPIAFSLAFVHAMRKRKDLSHIPSVRTAVALPRFLTARRFRTGALTPADLVAAAVLLTPLEDQGAAFETARGIVFKRAPPPDAKAGDASDRGALAVPVVAAVDDSKRDDDAPSILEDLAGMNLDLGALDLSTLDSLLDAKIADATELKSLDLMTELSTSGDTEDKGLAQLATSFGGAAELEAAGVHEKGALKRMLLERLFGQLGSLDPETAVQAAKAGFADDVLDDVTVPWERAALLAADATPADAEDRSAQLDALLDGVMQGGDAKEIGKTLRYLREAAPPARVTPFRARALSSVRHLADWAEIVDGMGTFEEPPEDLVASSAVENLPRTLLAAGALEAAFKAASKLDDGRDAWDEDDDHDDADDADDDADDEADEAVDFDDANERAPPPPRADIRHTAFGAWAAQLTETPSLDFLLEVYVPVDHWAKLARLAFTDIVRELDTTRPLNADQRFEHIRALLPLGPRLLRTRSDPARQLAAELATAVLVVVNDKARFLPLLDALVDNKLMPHDGNAVVAAGVALGLAEDDILARLSQPLEQLRFLIEGNIQDLKRHLDLVDKIEHIPDELLAHLVQCCVRDKNLMGLATLLAIALGPTLALAPQELSDSALQYKGIGSGENLLLQWYLHRDSLPSAFKDRVKALAKHALLEAALPWMHKGAGGAERGLIPQSRTRPYRAGDDVDSIDIEGTLEMLATSGKTPEQMSTDDLVVHDTSGGRAGFGVLIDISGSMTGKDLAVCAIAVVMLLGRLKPEEIAIALFESNTHVVKRFAEVRELDDVAGDLLELRATGGTQVDAALTFIADEFASQAEVERRVLFLLSDFMFFEDKKELAPHLERLAGLAVRFLGAAHGHFDKEVAQSFVDVVGGQVAKLASIEKLPDTLLQALAWISDGAE